MGVLLRIERRRRLIYLVGQPPPWECLKRLRALRALERLLRKLFRCGLVISDLLNADTNSAGVK